MGHRILDAALRHLAHSVAGDADNEQLAQTAAEQELRRHTAVRAADQHGERMLRHGDLKTARAPFGTS